MKRKLLFLNTGWMDFYRGLSHDTITGGCKHVQDHGWGEEMFNFQAFSGHCYGYVQPKIDKTYFNPSIIKIEKLGACESSEKVNKVTLVWTARDPHNGGTYIVGWYKDATVFRYYQEAPRNSKRNYKKHSMGYYVMTRSKNAKLLPVDERIVRIQRQKKGWMGQSNVWYAENNPAFIKLVEAYIFKGIIPAKSTTKKKVRGGARQSDPLKRIEVEKKAILFVKQFYEKLGYKIKSVEKDNLAWDLTATNNKTHLRLEVKGLSGHTISTELTSNEYEYLKKDKKFYRLCIVTNSLERPNLKIFPYSKDVAHWCTEDGKILQIYRVISARVCT